VYASDELRQQALSTVAVENPRGWRIAKEKASKKIDAIVALATACVAAMAHRGEIGSRSARGFNRAMHVSREKLGPLQGAPVYIGKPLSTCRQPSLRSSPIMERFTFWRHSRAKAWAFGATLRPS
jgi:hypothetical protein